LVRVAAFVTAEHVVPFIFPWYLANSQWNFPLASQICDLFGVLGLSAVLVAFSALLVDGTRRASLILGVIVALDLGYGAVRLAQVDAAVAVAPKVRIGLVEGDIGIFEKAKIEHVANNLAIHQRLSRILADAGAELIVWPESAYNNMSFAESVEAIPPSPVPLPKDPAWEALKLPADTGHLVLADYPSLTDASRDAAAKVEQFHRIKPQRGFTTPLLIGAVTYAPEPNPIAEGRRWERKLMNSALLLDEKGRVGGRVYHKNYLLVFGEYIPLGTLIPAIYDLVPEASNFTPGEEVTVFELGPLPRSGATIRAGVMICYEAIIPRWTRKLVGKRDPNVLINITNDAWFGKKGEPWMHMILTTFRAIENRKALVRSTNTGISVFVDPAGRITSQTSVDHPEVLMADVPLMEGVTLYRTIGDVIGWLAMLLLGAIALTRRLAHPIVDSA
jgi:apolipoprotein N-acyltransferase